MVDSVIMPLPKAEPATEILCKNRGSGWPNADTGGGK